MAYTITRIESASVTKAGLEMFSLMPDEIQLADTDGHVRTILSLMARNAAKAWRAMEEQHNTAPYVGTIRQAAWKAGGDRRRELHERADKVQEAYTRRWERVEEGCEQRLDDLAAILSTVTGYTWTIAASGGGMGHVLVIPDGLKARDNSRSYREQRPAIWLSGR